MDSSDTAIAIKISHALPRYVAFRGPNGKYLGYVRNHEYRGFLSFCYDDLASPCVKHEVVVAKNGQVHIKCSYIGKFWRKRSPKEAFIVAASNSPNADLSSWSSTLFRPDFLDANANPTRVSLRLLQGNHPMVCRGKEYNNNNLKMGSCMFASQEGGSMEYYEAVPLVKLPRYLALKGDNNNYLAGAYLADYNHLSFNTDDKGNDQVRQEVVESAGSDGKIRIKNSYWNHYWHLSPVSLWILANDNIIDDQYKQFLPVQLDDEKVALQCQGGNKYFCKRHHEEIRSHCLKGAATSLEKSAIFKVEECVMKRRVHSIVYDMATAHVYDLQPLVLATGGATNETDKPAVLSVGFTYSDKKTSSWSNSLSFKTGISFKFTAGVPLVVSGDVTVSAEVSYTRQWGESSETLTGITTSYAVTVGPGKKVSVDMVATQGKCNVEFSYVQEDLLTTGQTVSYTRGDGLFSGVNYFDIKYVVKELN